MMHIFCTWLRLQYERQTLDGAPVLQNPAELGLVWCPAHQQTPEEKPVNPINNNT